MRAHATTSGVWLPRTELPLVVVVARAPPHQQLMFSAVVLQIKYPRNKTAQQSRYSEKQEHTHKHTHAKNHAYADNATHECESAF